MSTIWTLVRATTVVVGSSAALLAGGLMGTAQADPAQPVPAPNIGDQLATSAANAPQVLQNLATALGAQPPAPPPLASAGIRVPQPAPAALPGASSVIPGPTSLLPGPTSLLPGETAAPGIAGIPGLTPTLSAPAAAAPVSGPAGLLPTAHLDLPQVPFLPVPLPQQVSLPGGLGSLTPGGVAVPRGVNQPSTTVASVPVTAPAALVPVIAPVTPVSGTAPNPLLVPLLSGLP